MEYNTNTYVTISHDDCVALNLGESHRTNNDGSVCILEYAEGQEIPAEIQAVIIQSYTHQGALELVEQAEWTAELPM